MEVADLNHGRARFGKPFIVFAVSATATVPGVAAFDDPAFLHRRESRTVFRPHLDFNGTAVTFLRQPPLQRFVVGFVVAEDRLQPGELGCRNQTQQPGGGTAVIRVGSRDEHSPQQSQRVDQQMTLAALDVLPRQSLYPP